MYTKHDDYQNAVTGNKRDATAISRIGRVPETRALVHPAAAHCSCTCVIRAPFSAPRVRQRLLSGKTSYVLPLAVPASSALSNLTRAVRNFADLDPKSHAARVNRWFSTISEPDRKNKTRLNRTTTGTGVLNTRVLNFTPFECGRCVYISMDRTGAK